MLTYVIYILAGYGSYALTSLLLKYLTKFIKNLIELKKTIKKPLSTKHFKEIKIKE